MPENTAVAWPTDDSQLPVIPLATVAAHNTHDSCWVIIHSRVYDLTRFLPLHPGGQSVILKQAGRDGTKAFDLVHPPDIIHRILTPDVLLGRVDPQELLSREGDAGSSSEEGEEETRLRRAREALPPLSSILNLLDFEALARTVLPPASFAYYSSGADDELTLRENRRAFLRIWLVPRVLVNVRAISTESTLLNNSSVRFSMPVYVSATALGKLGHPEGEVVLTRACATRRIPQMLPTLASCSLDAMCDARTSPTSPTQWFQLYVNQDRGITESLVRQAERRGCQALFITVDAPQLGKREKDMRMKFTESAPDVQTEGGLGRRDQGAARAISSFIDPGLCWKDLEWFKSITRMPIVLKGVQCAEDAVLAYKHGCAGVVVSNHGGRQLDTARSGIEVLPEVIHAIRNVLRVPKEAFSVFVDGGVRRGSDVFKALALGADAVGVGRPFLYAMSAYGQPGVEKAIDILEDELKLTMRLMGTPRLEDVRREMVKTGSLDVHGVAVPRDALAEEVYVPIQPPKPRL